MTCPYLEYRRRDGEQEFDHERPYCTVSESFVSPMRADVCNDRSAFRHDADCDVYPGVPDEEAPAAVGETMRTDGSD